MVFDSDVCFKKDGTPLKSYDSEWSANEGAEYVRNRYGNEQVPYKCDRCGLWHLSPVERQTKNHLSSCFDSSGKPKAAYETSLDAERRAKILKEEKDVYLKVYKCPDCGYWHLTHILSQLY